MDDDIRPNMVDDIRPNMVDELRLDRTSITVFDKGILTTLAVSSIHPILVGNEIREYQQLKSLSEQLIEENREKSKADGTARSSDCILTFVPWQDQH